MVKTKINGVKLIWVPIGYKQKEEETNSSDLGCKGQ